MSASHLLSGYEHLERVETESFVETLLSCLTNKERSVIERHFWEGISIREIAMTDGLTRAGIYHRISSGISRLKQKILRESKLFEDVIPDMHSKIIAWKNIAESKNVIRRSAPRISSMKSSDHTFPSFSGLTGGYRTPYSPTPFNRVPVQAMVHIQKSNNPNDSWDDIVIEPL